MHDTKIIPINNSFYSPKVSPFAVSWQKALTDIITKPQELLELVELSDKIKASDITKHQFPLRVTREFASRIVPGDLKDPLLRQVLPIDEELIVKAGFVDDPLQESQVNPEPGLLHKYHGRVLLISTGSCAIHCRYCFRRHFSYETNNPGRLGWMKALSYIANDESIEEVIFSGGDPLMIPDGHLQWFITELEKISHLKLMRFHTRLPVVLPQRITESLLKVLSNSRLQTVMVIHSNHAQEIDEFVEESLHRLQKASITVLNQSVLLAGVNDSVAALAGLSKRLFACGVIPYYLHMLDPTAGTGHFQVPLETAKTLYKELQNTLSGYFVPKLAQEVAGEKAKVLVI